MSESTGMAYILVVCALILFIVFTKEKVTSVVRFLLRGVVLSGGIWLINQILLLLGFAPLVGVNLVTVLTSATLGIPGVCLLFAMVLW